MAFDEALAARIRKALESRRDVEEKHMFGGVAFMVAGHMACGILGDSLMARIDPTQAERWLGEPHVRPMDFTGRPMKGLIFVDGPGLATPRQLKAWVDRCVAWVETLPSKKPARRRG